MNNEDDERPSESHPTFLASSNQELGITQSLSQHESETARAATSGQYTANNSSQDETSATEDDHKSAFKKRRSSKKDAAASTSDQVVPPTRPTTPTSSLASPSRVSTSISTELEHNNPPLKATRSELTLNMSNQFGTANYSAKGLLDRFSRGSIHNRDLRSGMNQSGHSGFAGQHSPLHIATPPKLRTPSPSAMSDGDSPNDDPGVFSQIPPAQRRALMQAHMPVEGDDERLKPPNKRSNTYNARTGDKEDSSRNPILRNIIRETDKNGDENDIVPTLHINNKRSTSGASREKSGSLFHDDGSEDEEEQVVPSTPNESPSSSKQKRRLETYTEFMARMEEIGERLLYVNDNRPSPDDPTQKETNEYYAYLDHRNTLIRKKEKEEAEKERKKKELAIQQQKKIESDKKKNKKNTNNHSSTARNPSAITAHYVAQSVKDATAMIKKGAVKSNGERKSAKRSVIQNEEGFTRSSKTIENAKNKPAVKLIQQKKKVQTVDKNQKPFPEVSDDDDDFFLNKRNTIKHKKVPNSDDDEEEEEEEVEEEEEEEELLDLNRHSLILSHSSFGLSTQNRSQYLNYLNEHEDEDGSRAGHDDDNDRMNDIMNRNTKRHSDTRRKSKSDKTRELDDLLSRTLEEEDREHRYEEEQEDYEASAGAEEEEEEDEDEDQDDDDDEDEEENEDEAVEEDTEDDDFVKNSTGHRRKSTKQSSQAKMNKRSATSHRVQRAKSLRTTTQNDKSRTESKLRARRTIATENQKAAEASLSIYKHFPFKLVQVDIRDIELAPFLQTPNDNAVRSLAINLEENGFPMAKICLKGYRKKDTGMLQEFVLVSKVNQYYAVLQCFNNWRETHPDDDNQDNNPYLMVSMHIPDKVRGEAANIPHDRVSIIKMALKEFDPSKAVSKSSYFPAFYLRVTAIQCGFPMTDQSVLTKALSQAELVCPKEVTFLACLPSDIFRKLFDLMKDNVSNVNDREFIRAMSAAWKVNRKLTEDRIREFIATRDSSVKETIKELREIKNSVIAFLTGIKTYPFPQEIATEISQRVNTEHLRLHFSRIFSARKRLCDATRQHKRFNIDEVLQAFESLHDPVVPFIYATFVPENHNNLLDDRSDHNCTLFVVDYDDFTSNKNDWIDYINKRRYPTFLLITEAGRNVNMHGLPCIPVIASAAKHHDRSFGTSVSSVSCMLAGSPAGKLLRDKELNALLQNLDTTTSLSSTMLRFLSYNLSAPGYPVKRYSNNIVYLYSGSVSAAAIIAGMCLNRVAISRRIDDSCKIMINDMQEISASSYPFEYLPKDQKKNGNAEQIRANIAADNRAEERNNQFSRITTPSGNSARTNSRQTDPYDFQDDDNQVQSSSPQTRYNQSPLINNTTLTPTSNYITPMHVQYQPIPPPSTTPPPLTSAVAARPGTSYRPEPFDPRRVQPQQPHSAYPYPSPPNLQHQHHSPSNVYYDPYSSSLAHNAQHVAYNGSMQHGQMYPQQYNSMINPLVYHPTSLQHTLPQPPVNNNYPTLQPNRSHYESNRRSATNDRRSMNQTPRNVQLRASQNAPNSTPRRISQAPYRPNPYDRRIERSPIHQEAPSNGSTNELDFLLQPMEKTNAQTPAGPRNQNHPNRR